MAKYHDHHRQARSRGGGEEKENISRIKRKLHEAYHLLFNTDPPREIARTLTKMYIDRRFYLVSIPRKKKKPNKLKISFSLEQDKWVYLVAKKKRNGKVKISI